MGGLTLHISAARDHERRIAASPRQSHRRELGSRSSFPQVAFDSDAASRAHPAAVAVGAYCTHSISGDAEALPSQRVHLLGKQDSPDTNFAAHSLG
jgi:hypothetical protein